MTKHFKIFTCSSLVPIILSCVDGLIRLAICYVKTRQTDRWMFGSEKVLLIDFIRSISPRRICVNIYVDRLVLPSDMQTYVGVCSDMKTNVTRWLYYFSIFGHSHQLKLPQKCHICAKLCSVFCQIRKKLSKICQIHVNFCQSGEFRQIWSH